MKQFTKFLHSSQVQPSNVVCCTFACLLRFGIADTFGKGLFAGRATVLYVYVGAPQTVQDGSEGDASESGLLIYYLPVKNE